MAALDPLLTPPQSKGHLSVARLARWWYVACRAKQLGARPLARTVLGVPMVLFRAAGGRPAALLDRCPHRNVPLSLGRVVGDGRLECAYHGWQFDGGGRCRLVPGLCDDASGDPGSETEGRRTSSFAARERDGFVWVYASADEEPRDEPPPLPHAADAGYTTVVRELEMECTLHAALENALDVPHTAFLHRGLFRGGGERHEIKAVVRASRRGVEAEYVGEPRPPGLAGRLLSPSGGIVEHWDRFLLPSIAQVEYRLGTENHLLVTSLCTPVGDFTTRMLAVVSFRLRVPGSFVRPLLTPVAMRIFRQDASILRLQSSTIRRFGGEQFMSTEIDVLGPHIWRLLKQAEADALPAGDETTTLREVRLAV
ncbi:MAG: aromatic ring-hydroxylating dioxygenase subunit alpha [Thermodesulfobacteriota bacterium]